MMASRVPTVLVTGGTGYIATHIVQQLQQAGHKVRATVRSLNHEQKIKPLKQLCPSAIYPLELVEADLLKADSWPAAVRNCSYVIHTASPVPVNLPKDELEVICPAVNGTLAVLRACREVGGVKRVVLTSSIAAVTGGIENRRADARFSEGDWTDPTKTNVAYSKSKALAEKAAWDFVSELSDENMFELAVINPGIVLGPVICGGHAASLEIVMKLLEKHFPAIPHTNIAFADVRDVAAAHVVAMTLPEAAGHRHIVAPHNLWFKDIAEILKKEFGPLGYSIPTMLAPYLAVMLLSLWDTRAKYLLMGWGITTSFDTTRMVSILGIQPRDAQDTLIHMAHSLIKNGFVKKTTRYAQLRA
jgi:nucleoside-diphosphate-sugar epimerase